VLNDVKLYDLTKAEGIQMQPPEQCSLSDFSYSSFQIQIKVQMRTVCCLVCQF